MGWPCETGSLVPATPATWRGGPRSGIGDVGQSRGLAVHTLRVLSWSSRRPARYLPSSEPSGGRPLRIHTGNRFRQRRRIDGPARRMRGFRWTGGRSPLPLKPRGTQR